MLKPFAGVQVPLEAAAAIKRRYSVTGDIVSYRRCARQYGALHVHKFAPAHQTQLYFGNILHQVLDRCHAHYHGVIDPTTKNTLPDNGLVLTDHQVNAYFQAVADSEQNGTPTPSPPTRLIEYFLEVEKGLKSQGIRAITPDLRMKALRLLQYFNFLEGPALYPRVVETEHRLQADQNTHILHGVVDLLLDDPSHSGNPAEGEIWDYKGTSRVGMTTEALQTYRFQMRVYARLYALKHGILPKRVVLYFLNELDGPTPPAKRPVNATLVMDASTGLSVAEIESAMQAFNQTVTEIEVSRTKDEWLAAVPGTIGEQDCAICDLRWDCKTPHQGQGVKLRYP